ncbi:hypothetical protein BCR42DRAFT_410428 [Absidia repens]|uniref:Uncharacterized protein n=1 Tax=Absidia repens TaxID=90262 RepID=A0A1X2INZ5_9FUNG|nr:hypothetical protein BCR42DRAFT_410428 [Absidia repens]
MTRYDANQVTKDPLQQDDYPCATLPSNDLTRFPYALLCVKLPHNFSDTGVVKSSSSSSLSSPSFTPSFSWLAQLFSCPMLEPMQDFSLYLHGVSILFPDKVDVLPHWFEKMDLDLQRMETQGYLSGLRSSSPNHSETRATTPEPMDTSFAETPQAHTLPPLHPLGHESNPTINYFTCTTTTADNAPSSSMDMHWIQPHLSALAWFRNTKEKKGLGQQQDRYHTSIDMPSGDNPMETSTTSHLYDDNDTTWEETMVMAKRPVPLTLLCGVVSFIVAYILYVVVTL